MNQTDARQHSGALQRSSALLAIGAKPLNRFPVYILLRVGMVIVLYTYAAAGQLGDPRPLFWAVIISAPLYPIFWELVHVAGRRSEAMRLNLWSIELFANVSYITFASTADINEISPVPLLTVSSVLTAATMFRTEYVAALAAYAVVLAVGVHPIQGDGVFEIGSWYAAMAILLVSAYAVTHGRSEEQLRIGIAQSREEASKQRAKAAASAIEASGFRLLFEANPHPMLVYDPRSLAVIEVNTAAIEQFGYDAEEFRTKTLSDLHPPEDVPLLLERLGSGDSGGEWRHQRKDGSLIWVDIRSDWVELRGQPLRLVVATDITEMKHARASIVESERALASAQSLAHIGSWIWDIGANTVSWSDELYELLGLEKGKDEPSFQALQAAAGLPERDSFREFLKALEAGVIPEIELRRPDADGRRRFLATRAEQIRDETGKLVRVLGTIQDITEQRESEQALRESEQRARELIENANDIIYTSDLKGRITSINRRAVEVLGYSREEMIGTNPESIMPPDSAEVAQRLSAEMEANPTQPGRAVLRLVARDGHTVIVESIPRVIYRDGQPTEVLGIVRDITERYTANEALRRSEQHLSDVLDNVAAFVGTVLPDGTFAEANRGPLEIAGLSPSDVFGKPFWETYWWSFSEESKQKLQDAIHSAADGHAVRWDARVRVGENEYLTMDVSLAPIRDRAGAVSEIVASAVDITDRLALESRLRQAERMEAVGQLAGGIAHDFNNILTVINGYGDLIVASMDGADPLYEPAVEVVAAATRAGALTRQLLAFSRHQEVLHRVIDLNGVVTELTTMLRRIIGETIELETSLCPGLPDVLADPGQMEQVILNLVVNARDAMAGSGRLSIETATDRVAGGEETVILTVTDTGTGMTADILDHLFDPFFTTKGAGEGTGLGLATVYGIMGQIDGSVEVESTVGQGSRFTLRFPVAER